MRPIAVPSALLLALTLAVPVSSATAAPPLPAGVERGPALEGIAEYRLANGLSVLLFPDPSQPTVTVNVTYLVGSRFEDYGETGMAHLLEHLMFKGSTRHRDIPHEMDERGARSNASTWYDRTNYFEVVPANDANLDWALDLEADRMVGSFIAKKDLDSEMTVVRNEFEMGESEPMAVVEERTMEAAYDWHSYGKPTIGARSDIENVPIERLQAFYHRYYQPDNAVLLIAGKLDPARTLALVTQKFGSIPRPARSLPAIYTQEPVQDGERQVTVRRTGDVQVVLAAYHIAPGVHPDSAADALLTRVLGDRATGRLHKELVETGKATDVFGSDYELHDPGLMIFGARVRKGQPLDAAREALLATVEAPHFAKVTEAEVERARNAELKQVDLTLHSSTRLGLQLSEWISQGDWRLYFLQRDRIRQVKAADLDRVAAAYLKPANRTLGLFLPDDHPDRAAVPERPTATELAGLLKDYKGDAAMAEGEAFEPSPGNIMARTTKRELAGGLKLALLPKKTRGGTVNASLSLDFGDLESSRGKAMVGSLTSLLLMRGTQRHSRQQIEDELARLRAEVRVYGGIGGASASIQTVRENLPAALRLVAEMLREPAFPQSELEQVRREVITRAEASRTDPESVASVAFERALNPYPKDHPDYVMTPDEMVAAAEAVTREQIVQLHDGFFGASAGQLAVVGDFDPAAVQALAQELFGSWKSPHGYQRIVHEYTDVAAEDRALETPDKANASLYAGLAMPLGDDDPDYPALALANYILGGGSNSHLENRIREKEGLSYGVGSFLAASDLDKLGTFGVFAICAPQNMAKVETDVREEIERARRDGFTAAEVAAAKSGYLAERELRRTRDGSIAGTLTHYLHTGRTYAWDQAMEARIAALTPAELQAAVERHLDPARLLVMKAGDFAHAVGKPPAAVVHAAKAAAAPVPRH
jgi:zinc protease